MDARGIILLSDISGYTEFLSRTAIDHANWIVANLFSAMLEEIPLKLKVMEVEGDALFCWIPLEPDEDAAASINPLVDHQFRRFVGVQRWLVDVHRCGETCDCHACGEVRNLRIKFILHAGRVGTYRIADYEKIGGMDVVIAHRLLKNSVPLAEYELVTAELFPTLASEGEEDVWTRQIDEYPVVGEVSYYYRKLERDPSNDIITPPFPHPPG